MKKKLEKLWAYLDRILILTLCIAFFSCNKPSSPQLPNLISNNLELNWQFRKVGTEHWHPASVPGSVHTDLIAAGIIEDPFVDNNELAVQWIENENWEYRCLFEVHSDLLKMRQIILSFEGLDTYAEVVLNNQKILEANNMFTPWQADVKNVLVEGENELLVIFQSPIVRHKDEKQKLGYQLPADNDSSFTSPFVRKAAYHFGWDWAPRMVTSGIWKSVTISAFNEARLIDVFVETLKLDKNVATLRAYFKVEVETSKEYTFKLGGKSKKFLAIKGLHSDSLDFEISEPKLWQPNGTGDSYLYYLNAFLSDSLLVLDDAEVRLGLRKIQLVQEPDDIGTAFYFKVNDKPLFIKGANYIPQDVFIPRVTDKQYRELLRAVKDAGMNMLRVWGGGIYENEIFYQLCDSLGIMVWQDFMFAGTVYPGDAAFLKNVEHEVEYQVKRLRKHPCLALWCGNNEIDVAWKNWGWQKKYGYTVEDSIEIWKNHLNLFDNIIPELVKKHSPRIQYVPTTPLSNWGKADNFNHATMHYWGVWHGRDIYESYKTNVGRFMVEYGMQSYPTWETLSKYVSKENLYLDSKVMINRQKSYIGNGEIEKQMELLALNYQGFNEFVLMSQQSQAQALDIALSAHLNSNGHCMGTLFWQLNDCWPGPSWSVIDYKGQKKLGYYTVKEKFTK